MKKSKLIYKLNKWYRKPSCRLNEAISNFDCKEYNIHIRRKRYRIYKQTGTRWDFPLKRQKNWKSRAKINHQYNKYKKSFKEINYYDHDLAAKNNFLFKLKKLKERDGVGWYYFSKSGNDWHYLHPRLFDDIDYHDIAIKLFKEGLIIAEYFCKDINDLNDILIIRCKIFD